MAPVFCLRTLNVFIADSRIGSDAIEAAKKMSIQYHAKDKLNLEPTRKLFIARHHSYHGATPGALALSGYPTRRDPYRENIPSDTFFIPACNEWRDKRTGESIPQYVGRLKQQLIDMIIYLGPENVAGFFMEPVVGAVSTF
jgi:adenosylmethionine-8-amino-7-oxononanoate aminotransferase